MKRNDQTPPSPSSSYSSPFKRPRNEDNGNESTISDVQRQAFEEDSNLIMLSILHQQEQQQQEEEHPDDKDNEEEEQPLQEEEETDMNNHDAREQRNNHETQHVVDGYRLQNNENEESHNNDENINELLNNNEHHDHIDLPQSQVTSVLTNGMNGNANGLHHRDFRGGRRDRLEDDTMEGEDDTNNNNDRWLHGPNERRHPRVGDDFQVQLLPVPLSPQQNENIDH